MDILELPTQVARQSCSLLELDCKEDEDISPPELDESVTTLPEEANSPLEESYPDGLSKDWSSSTKLASSEQAIRNAAKIAQIA